MKHWNLQFVLDNITECNATYQKMRELPTFISEESYFETNQNRITI